MTAVARRRLSAAHRRLRTRLTDDRGSLPMALLLIMLGMALAAAMLPTLIVQNRASVFDASRTDNLAAAQAGIDVVTGDIRAASKFTGAGVVGNVAALPCATPSRPLTGPVNGVGKAGYSAYVAYYVLDPVAHPAATPMICVPGRGTYDPVTSSLVPGYARITSTGTDGTAAAKGASVSRTLTATYVFQTSDADVPDGQIRSWPSDSTSWCLDAGSARPQAGVTIVLQHCSTTVPVSPQQLFRYRSDLTIQLATSITTGYPNGLCLDTASATSGPLVGDTVVVNRCRGLNSPTYSQQWSFNENSGFTASVSTTARDGLFALPGYAKGLCLSAATQAAGAPITLADCRNGAPSSTSQAWLPAPSVGVGAAAAPQLVNDQQFSRCLTVTVKPAGDQTSTSQASAAQASTRQASAAQPLLAYPCVQNPFASAVPWTQQFTYDAGTGWLTTTTNGIRYCLASPETEGGQVLLTPCNQRPDSPIGAAQLVWTLPGTTAVTPAAQRSTIVDSGTDAPRCLGISPPAAAAGSPWWVITVTACNGSTAQKWNADPNLGTPSLQDTVELTAGVS